MHNGTALGFTDATTAMCDRSCDGKFYDSLATSNKNNSITHFLLRKKL